MQKAKPTDPPISKALIFFFLPTTTRNTSTKANIANGTIKESMMFYLFLKN
jgi:hypothetical protein